MSSDGYIITNAHVVAGASVISVVFTDETENEPDAGARDDSSKSITERILEQQGDADNTNVVNAERIGIDEQTDLAVLKVDKKGLTEAKFGSSNDVQVGELAIVIGNPLGFELSNTVTVGIISATNRHLTVKDRTMNLIQTDASINKGNSGGPLINAYGRVIGITSAKVNPDYNVEGLGFAIPIDEAKIVIDDLIHYGYVKGRPTLGIEGKNIDAVNASYYDIPQGFIVTKLETGSAAEKAGIMKGDIICGIEGITIKTIEEFNKIK
jgi:serine protease Do